MLRITETDVTVDGTKLRLDGKMAGPWVPVLKLLCDPILAKGQQIQVDCVGVSSLDNDGIALLQGEGVTLVNCSAFIKLRLAKEYRRGDEKGHIKTIPFLISRASLLFPSLMY